MRSALTKKKLFAVMAMACAVVLALVGIPFAVTSASAAETRGLCCAAYGVAINPEETAVAYYYRGHKNCPQYEDSKYINLGINANPNYGYETKTGNEYVEVMIPEIGMYGTSSPYGWMRPSTEPGITRYQGHYVISMAQGSELSVTNRLVSGTVTANQNVSFALPSGWNTVEGNCVYDGYIGKFSLSRQQRSNTINLYLDEDDTPDVVFGVSISGSLLKFNCNKSFTCSDRVARGSLKGAISYHVE